VPPFFASRTALVAMARYASTFHRSISSRNERSASHACPIDVGASRPETNTSAPRRTGARTVARSRQEPSGAGGVEAGGRDDFGAADGALASTTRRRSALEPTSMAAKRGIPPKPSGKRPWSASARVERERFSACAAMDCGGRGSDGGWAGCCRHRAGGWHCCPRPHPTATGRGRNDGRGGVGAAGRWNSSIRTRIRHKRGPRRRKRARIAPPRLRIRSATQRRQSPARDRAFAAPRPQIRGPRWKPSPRTGPRPFCRRARARQSP
jgi:hypothetical protein